MRPSWNEIVQAIITLILVATSAALYLTQKEVPEGLLQATMLVLGFWFGSRSEAVISRAIASMRK